MDFNSIVRTFTNPATIAQLAMGPAGWAQIAGRVLLSAIGQQAIQIAGDRLGLPQSVINGAKTAFSAASGAGPGSPQTVNDAMSTLRDMGLSPRSAGDVQRAADKTVKSFADFLTEESVKAGRADDEGRLGGSGKPKSKLVALAAALGKLMDTKMDDMIALGKEIDGMKKAGKEVMEKSAEMQALGQELGMLSAATSNVIKSIGEASSQLARKS